MSSVQGQSLKRRESITRRMSSSLTRAFSISSRTSRDLRRSSLPCITTSFVPTAFPNSEFSSPIFDSPISMDVLIEELDEEEQSFGSPPSSLQWPLPTFGRKNTF